MKQQDKKGTRADKRSFIHDLTEAETAAGKKGMKRLYEITRTLSWKNKAPSRPVKDKDGETITDEAKERARWADASKRFSTDPHHKSYLTCHQQQAS